MFNDYNAVMDSLSSSHSGLYILFGLPRTGKTTLMQQFHHDFKERDEEVVLLKQDEFDSRPLETNYIDNYVDDIMSFFLFHDHVRILMVDSAKNLLYKGSSLRKGGISNDVIQVLTDLSIFLKDAGKKVLLAFSSSSASYENIVEIATILSSCTDRFICLNSDREAIFDTEYERISIQDIIKHVQKSK